MAIKVEDISKNLYIIVKNSRNDAVEQVVHLQNTKIGTTSSPRSFDVTGVSTFGGVSYFSNARVTGSLQKTSDGGSYLVAGNGIRIFSGSNDQIVVHSSKDEIFSLARIAPSRGTTGPPGNFTVGIRFMPTQNVACTGVRFFGATANKTVKVTLWTDAGSSLANTSVSVIATGSYEGTFATPQSLSAGTLYKVSAYQTDTSNYQSTPPNSASLPPRPFYGGGYLTYVTINLISAGDVVPVGLSTTEVYMLEPILTVL